jgi:hypothetical protein
VEVSHAPLSLSEMDQATRDAFGILASELKVPGAGKPQQPVNFEQMMIQEGAVQTGGGLELRFPAG